MANLSNYWRFVRLDGRGEYRTDVVPIARQHMQQQFPQLSTERPPDLVIQRTLMATLTTAVQTQDQSQVTASLWCLRCFISAQIKRVCYDLAAQFRDRYGLQVQTLLPLVLDDANAPWAAGVIASAVTPNQPWPPTFVPLAAKILQSFDAQHGSLTTWAMRLVRNHRDLNRVLLEHGIYLVSDWAILNDTKPTQLNRILGEFQGLTPPEIQQAAQLLQRYHAVYRRDRLRQRQQGGTRRCSPPTPAQLQEMAALGALSPQDDTTDDSTAAVLRSLQQLATQIRQYRIVARGGAPTFVSLDQPELAAQLPQLTTPAPDEAEQEIEQFLQGYRQDLAAGLEATLTAVIGDRVTRLHKRQPEQAQRYLKALHYFYCEGKTMGDIAPLVGLTQQYQVSRLLKLKDLRTDVWQRLLVDLGDRVRQRVRLDLAAEQFAQLDITLEPALSNQIEVLMTTAEQEAISQRDCPPASLFARTLCQHLHTQHPHAWRLDA